MKNPADMTDDRLQEIIEAKFDNWADKFMARSEQLRRMQEDIERCRGKLLRLKTILEEN